MKTCINISYPSKIRFRKKVHSQTSDHVWFFLNLFSKRPREKKKKGRKNNAEIASPHFAENEPPKVPDRSTKTPNSRMIVI